MNFVSITTIFNLVVEIVKFRENDMGVYGQVTFTLQLQNIEEIKSYYSHFLEYKTF